MNPSLTFHGAGAPPGVRQASRLVPSNRMTASLGAGTAPTAGPPTGSTTGGLGRLISCWSQRLCLAASRNSSAAMIATIPAVQSTLTHVNAINFVLMCVNLLMGKNEVEARVCCFLVPQSDGSHSERAATMIARRDRARRLGPGSIVIWRRLSLFYMSIDRFDSPRTANTIDRLWGRDHERVVGPRAS